MFISTWEWIRLLGLLSYFYFTVSIIFGLLRKSSFLKSKNNLLFQIHQSAAWFGFITIIAHMLVLIIDQYEPYRIAEILIPFESDYEPILSGLGTIAFYLFLGVMVTSDLWIRKMSFNIWKKVHILVLPAWFLSLLHGIFIGTDTKSDFILLLYAGSVGLVVMAAFLRIISKNKKKTTSHMNGATASTHSLSTEKHS